MGQAGTASNIREDERASSGVRVCILCADSTQTSHLPEEALCTGEATIMMGGDTKKDAHKVVEIHYNMPHHEHTPRGGGLARVAGQSCLAGPSVLRLHPRFGHRPGWVYGRELRPESQAFLCGATNFFTPQATSLVVALLPPASLLALSPHRPPLTATSIPVSALHLQEPASRRDTERSTG